MISGFGLVAPLMVGFGNKKGGKTVPKKTTPTKVNQGGNHGKKSANGQTGRRQMKRTHTGNNGRK